jgi:hypothetical protein
VNIKNSELHHGNAHLINPGDLASFELGNLIEGQTGHLSTETPLFRRTLRTLPPVEGYQFDTIKAILGLSEANGHSPTDENCMNQQHLKRIFKSLLLVY